VYLDGEVLADPGSGSEVFRTAILPVVEDKPVALRVSPKRPVPPNP